MMRHHFPGVTATGTGATVCTGTSNPSAHTEPNRFAEPRLLRMLRDPALMRHLGRRFRELHPAEDNAQILADTIGRVAPESIFTERELPTETAVQREFAAGRTVMLDGWVLAISEARQCALLSLQA